MNLTNWFAFRFSFVEKDDDGTIHIIRFQIGYFWFILGIIALIIWLCHA